MLQSGYFTSYLIGTYWAQWLAHARKFITKWHCWKLVCVHCCVAMIKLIIWMYGVFIIYVMQLLVQITNIKSFVSDNKPFFKHSMNIFYNMHFYRALRNTDTRNNWCPRCVPCLQRGIVPYEIIWWVKYKLTIKVHMRGYKFSRCILFLDDTPLWCSITHPVKWNRFVSTLHMLHRMQHSIPFWKCPEYKCLASKVLV